MSLIAQFERQEKVNRIKVANIVRDYLNDDTIKEATKESLEDFVIEKFATVSDGELDYAWEELQTYKKKEEIQPILASRKIKISLNYKSLEEIKKVATARKIDWDLMSEVIKFVKSFEEVVKSRFNKMAVNTECNDSKILSDFCDSELITGYSEPIKENIKEATKICDKLAIMHCYVNGLTSVSDIVKVKSYFNLFEPKFSIETIEGVVQKKAAVQKTITEAEAYDYAMNNLKPENNIKTFEDFVKFMDDAGYEVGLESGKRIWFAIEMKMKDMPISQKPTETAPDIKPEITPEKNIIDQKAEDEVALDVQEEDVVKPIESSAKINKWVDEFVVQGHYGYGWEDLTVEETWKEAKQTLKEYNENETGVSHRIIIRKEANPEYKNEVKPENNTVDQSAEQEVALDNVGDGAVKPIMANKSKKNIKIATGEMSQSEVEEGGDWYELGLELQEVADEIGKSMGVSVGKPQAFDQYQGIYIQVGGWKLWFDAIPTVYVLEKDNKYIKGDVDTIIDNLKNNKFEIKSSVKPMATSAKTKVEASKLDELKKYVQDIFGDQYVVYTESGMYTLAKKDNSSGGLSKTVYLGTLSEMDKFIQRLIALENNGIVSINKNASVEDINKFIATVAIPKKRAGRSTNSKEVSEAIQKHILSYFNDDEYKDENGESLDAYNGMLKELKNYQDNVGLNELVPYGSFLIYYDEIREFLKNLLGQTDEEAKKYTDQQVWDLYCKLIEREARNILSGNRNYIKPTENKEVEHMETKTEDDIQNKNETKQAKIYGKGDLKLVMDTFTQIILRDGKSINDATDFIKQKFEISDEEAREAYELWDSEYRNKVDVANAKDANIDNKNINKKAYVEKVPNHKNSKGELAEWVIKDENTKEIQRSFKTKEEAEEGFRAGKYYEAHPDKKAGVGWGEQPENEKEEMAVKIGDEIIDSDAFDNDEWNNADQEERTKLATKSVQPVIQKYKNELKDKEIVQLVREHLEDNNFHTENEVFGNLVNEENVKKAESYNLTDEDKETIKKIIKNFDPIAVKYNGNNDDGYSVLIKDKNSDFESWMDVWVDDKDVDVDWNQYIYHTDIIEDVMKRKIEDDTETVFDLTSSEAINFLQDKGILVQDDNANWAYGKDMKNTGDKEAIKCEEPYGNRKQTGDLEQTLDTAKMPFGDEKEASENKEGSAESVIQSMYNAIDSGEYKIPYTKREGNWEYTLDKNYILHIKYYATEVITADFKNKKVLNVTTGGFDTHSTKAGITKALKALREMEYSDTDIKIETEASTEKQASEEEPSDISEMKKRPAPSTGYIEKEVVKNEEIKQIYDLAKTEKADIEAIKAESKIKSDALLEQARLVKEQIEFDKGLADKIQKLAEYSSMLYSKLEAAGNVAVDVGDKLVNSYNQINSRKQSGTYAGLKEYLSKQGLEGMIEKYETTLETLETITAKVIEFPMTEKDKKADAGNSGLEGMVDSTLEAIKDLYSDIRGLLVDGKELKSELVTE